MKEILIKKEHVAEIIFNEIVDGKVKIKIESTKLQKDKILNNVVSADRCNGGKFNIKLSDGSVILNVPEGVIKDEQKQRNMNPGCCGKKL